MLSNTVVVFLLGALVGCVSLVSAFVAVNAVASTDT